MLFIGLLVGLIVGGGAGAYIAWGKARDRCQRELAMLAGKSAADIASTEARLDEWSK